MLQIGRTWSGEYSGEHQSSAGYQGPLNRLPFELEIALLEPAVHIFHTAFQRTLELGLGIGQLQDSP